MIDDNDYYYRLKEPIICMHSGRSWGFFGYISPNLNGPVWNPEYKWWVRTHAKQFEGNRPRGFT